MLRAVELGCINIPDMLRCLLSQHCVTQHLQMSAISNSIWIKFGIKVMYYSLSGAEACKPDAQRKELANMQFVGIQKSAYIYLSWYAPLR